MSYRFPQLRSQDQMMHKPLPAARAVPIAPVDLTLVAALAFVVALALI